MKPNFRGWLSSYDYVPKVDRQGRMHFAKSHILYKLLILVALLVGALYLIDYQGYFKTTLIMSTKVKEQPTKKHLPLNEILEGWVMTQGVSHKFATDIVNSVLAESTRQGVDPLLVLALIKVESNFNPFAISKSNALGLMQVIPSWHTDKIKAHNLFDVGQNIELGVKIMKEYESSSNDIMLLRYSGNTVNYAASVVAVRRNIQLYVDNQLKD